MSVLLPTLNEAARVGPCLAGLREQGDPVVEIVVIDSRSTDGTARVVEEHAAGDPRVRLVHDAPLPRGWIGKAWALEEGLRVTRGDWVLNVDADIAPERGMVAGAVAAAIEGHYDAVSFSPKFAGQSAGEQWVQPALLTTLVYRFGAAGADDPASDRVLANGQCFMARREVLERAGGYSSARDSFSEDVTLATQLKSRGARVGFLDGSRLYSVRSYTSLGQMWREWGRSIDLKDATTPARQWLDVLFLALMQGAPLVVIALLLAGRGARPLHGAALALLVLNALLLAIRVSLLGALRGSYDRPGPTFWLSPLADPLAVLRVAISSLRRPRSWRGRAYGAAPTGA